MCNRLDFNFQYIQAENFLCFRKLFRLGPIMNLNLVMGKNGSGKSSLGYLVECIIRETIFRLFVSKDSVFSGHLTFTKIGIGLIKHLNKIELKILYDKHNCVEYFINQNKCSKKKFYFMIKSLQMFNIKELVINNTVSLKNLFYKCDNLFILIEKYSGCRTLKLFKNKLRLLQFNLKNNTINYWKKYKSIFSKKKKFKKFQKEYLLLDRYIRLFSILDNYKIDYKLFFYIFHYWQTTKILKKNIREKKDCNFKVILKINLFTKFEKKNNYSNYKTIFYFFNSNNKKINNIIKNLQFNFDKLNSKYLFSKSLDLRPKNESIMNMIFVTESNIKNNVAVKRIKVKKKKSKLIYKISKQISITTFKYFKIIFKKKYFQNKILLSLFIILMISKHYIDKIVLYKKNSLLGYNIIINQHGVRGVLNNLSKPLDSKYRNSNIYDKCHIVFFSRKYFTIFKNYFFSLPFDSIFLSEIKNRKSTKRSNGSFYKFDLDMYDEILNIVLSKYEGCNFGLKFCKSKGINYYSIKRCQKISLNHRKKKDFQIFNNKYLYFVYSFKNSIIISNVKESFIKYNFKTAHFQNNIKIIFLKQIYYNEFFIQKCFIEFSLVLIFFLIGLVRSERLIFLSKHIDFKLNKKKNLSNLKIKLETKTIFFFFNNRNYNILDVPIKSIINFITLKNNLQIIIIFLLISNERYKLASKSLGITTNDIDFIKKYVNLKKILITFYDNSTFSSKLKQVNLISKLNKLKTKLVINDYYRSNNSFYNFDQDISYSLGIRISYLNYLFLNSIISFELKESFRSKVKYLNNGHYKKLYYIKNLNFEVLNIKIFNSIKILKKKIFFNKKLYTMLQKKISDLSVRYFLVFNSFSEKLKISIEKFYLKLTKSINNPLGGSVFLQIDVKKKSVKISSVPPASSIISTESMLSEGELIITLFCCLYGFMDVKMNYFILIDELDSSIDIWNIIEIIFIIKVFSFKYGGNVLYISHKKNLTRLFNTVFYLYNHINTSLFIQL
ncbi:hypothetical protein (nucleomorph) [Guillardia theta]|uniref:Uncharacterized protein n=2 Tax=Guillardia theta TaxID=55529 RepID=Q98RM3_GUITH|nr:hypothetical protein GTHECHR1132 [Guillardia theta]AAK39925.1 hypothetical protein [Guillardia theta]